MALFVTRHPTDQSLSFSLFAFSSSSFRSFSISPVLIPPSVLCLVLGRFEREEGRVVRVCADDEKTHEEEREKNKREGMCVMREWCVYVCVSGEREQRGG